MHAARRAPLRLKPLRELLVRALILMRMLRICRLALLVLPPGKALPPA